MKFFSGIIALAILTMLALGAVAWKISLFSGPGGPAKHFIVAKGDNFAHVGVRLRAEKIIFSERAFRWYVNILVPHKKLQRGEFLLHEGMGVAQVVYALTEGKPIEYKFTIPEGHNMYEVAEALEAAGLVGKATDFLAAARAPELIAQLPTLLPGQKHPKSLEGYLYPDTYLLQKVFSAKEIAGIMLARFKEVYKHVAAEVSASEQLKKFKMDSFDVITLASIVEKETGAAAERPIVASIFFNRMQKHMRLQTDPTIIYGMWDRDGFFDGKIHSHDIHNPTPYNTYVIDGLPPGPVANPGLSAIQAVLHPAQSDYLFFVSNNNGTHTFSKNLRDHQHAVQKTQINPAARDGKSWRDLPKDQRAK